MDKFDKIRHQQHMERLHSQGKSAIWKGTLRYCSPYPDLQAGMPGIWAPGDQPMFYPEAWKYRYGILGKPENVEVTDETPEHQPKLI